MSCGNRFVDRIYHHKADEEFPKQQGWRGVYRERGRDRMIRARDGFVIHKMMDNYMIIAVGEAAESFHSIIETNETGAFYWEMIEKGTTLEALIKAATERFEDLDEATAKKDIAEFLASISPAVETLQ